MEVHIHLPPQSDDSVSTALVNLTERITQVTGEETGYGLGGRFGYGENYENDVFMMHRFCWCERADCPWCLGCSCGDDWETNLCAYCRDEVKPAANFLHKASGASIRWYKYIGRGMDVDAADWPAIFAECMESLRVTARGGEGSDG